MFERDFIGLFLLSILIICSASDLYSKDKFIFSDSINDLELTNNVNVLLDSHHVYTVNDILKFDNSKFQSLEEVGNNFGYTTNKIWLTFDIENATDNRLFFLLNNPALHFVNLYVWQEDGKQKQYKSGSSRPFNTRNLTTSAFSFDLGFKPSAVVLEVASKTRIRTPMIVTSTNQMVDTLHHRDLLNGFILGTLIAMFLYNFFIFFNIRDAAYFWYLTWILLVILTELRSQGLGYEFIWPNTPFLNGGSTIPFHLIILAFITCLTKLLETKKYLKISHLILMILMGIVGASLFSLVFFDKALLRSNYLHLISTTYNIYFFLISLYLSLKGNKFATYIFLAFLLSISLTILGALGRTGLIASGFLFEHGQRFAIIIFAILISNAFAFKFNSYKEEALKESKEKEQLVKKQNIILETKVKERTNSLLTLNKKLDTINKSKDQLFAIIGHDLRKPALAFRGISKKIRFLLELKEFDTLDKLGSSIEKAAFSLNSLLDNLLNWALQQRDALPYKPLNLDIRDVVEETLDLFRQIAADKKINLNLNISKSSMVYADRNLLSTIIRNLVDNAVKYTPAGGRIEMTSKKIADGIILSIADTGIGMTEAQIEKMFELDHQKSQQGTNGEMGTGLGLHLVRDLVQLNKGKIKVESQWNLGTTFELIFPAV